MTEPTVLPPPDPPSEPATAATPSPSTPGRAPWLVGLGFVVLALAIVYVWQNPRKPSEPAASVASLHAVEQRLADVDARLTKLEQRPAPDLSKITSRLDALDGRLVDQAQLLSKIDTLSGRIESLSGRVQANADASSQQVGALTSRIASQETNAGSIQAAAKRLDRIAKLQEASFALASGRPVGDVPGAPEALSRYSHTAPPTERGLRSRFASAAQAALVETQPVESANVPFVGRVWDRAQGLITIRRGDDVVVGNPVTMTLNQAQASLESGDLPGAVAAIETLKGQPQQALAKWLADAKSLLDARSALDQMADHS